MPYQVCRTRCSNGGCTTYCYTVPCCPPGHYRLDIEVYIFSLFDLKELKAAIDQGQTKEEFLEWLNNNPIEDPDLLVHDYIKKKSILNGGSIWLPVI